MWGRVILFASLVDFLGREKKKFVYSVRSLQWQETKTGEGRLHAGEAGFITWECCRISWEGDLHS
jgi:hypothetical protein